MRGVTREGVMDYLVVTYDSTMSDSYKLLPLCGPQEANKSNTWGFNPYKDSSLSRFFKTVQELWQNKLYYPKINSSLPTISLLFYKLTPLKKFSLLTCPSELNNLLLSFSRTLPHAHCDLPQWTATRSGKLVCLPVQGKNHLHILYTYIVSGIQ